MGKNWMRGRILVGARGRRGKRRTTHQSQSLPNTGIHDWHILDFLIFNIPESTIRVSKHPLLFVIECLASCQQRSAEWKSKCRRKKGLTQHQACGRYGVMSMKKLLRRYVVRPLELQSSYVRYLDLSIPFRPCKLILGELRSCLLRAVDQQPHLRLIHSTRLRASLRSGDLPQTLPHPSSS